MTQTITQSPLLKKEYEEHENEEDTELVPPSDPRARFISVDPERMSGTPCFVGSRVPIKHLWDYLESGENIEEFLEGFEPITRGHVLAVLHMAYERLLEGLPKGTPDR